MCQNLIMISSAEQDHILLDAAGDICRSFELQEASPSSIRAPATLRPHTANKLACTGTTAVGAAKLRVDTLECMRSRCATSGKPLDHEFLNAKTYMTFYVGK
jgi:hypothetical protein